jgi:hypothetical protein
VSDTKYKIGDILGHPDWTEVDEYEKILDIGEHFYVTRELHATGLVPFSAIDYDDKIRLREITETDDGRYFKYEPKIPMVVGSTVTFLGGANQFTVIAMYEENSLKYAVLRRGNDVRVALVNAMVVVK